MSSRRKFLKEFGSVAILGSAGAWKAAGNEEAVEQRMLLAERKIAFNDVIRVGCIGFGIMGLSNIRTMLKVPGIELAGVCDLYTGRLQRAKELYGNNLFVTQDYREMLNRKDIDAVIVATSDHWHDRIAIDAMKKGKAVYCEKPMIHQLNEGWPVVNIQRETSAVLQVGSQRVSSVTFAKAKELFKSGEIGALNCIEACYDRQSARGAWQYTMPTDASPDTIAWDKYQGDAPKHAFDAKRFFWWRNYKDYGTGVAGDLFVHLLSGVHFVTDSYGPRKIFATGQLSYWKDGRDVPDVMTAIMDYPQTAQHPAFQVMLRVNFISGQGDRGLTRFIGSEGVIDFSGNEFTIRHSKMPKAPGYGGWDAFETYPESMQKEIASRYEQQYPKEQRTVTQAKDIVYRAPDGYSDSVDHFINFFEAMRSGKPVVEDAAFGFRAAAPCLACNDSYFKKKVIEWDGEKMKTV
ncbi:MAG TPA: Gfo/Idh/MocA family oxidoreductase [Chitinophagaceae bacterium]|nr:Gfo/Idh/MocA family oxidoreductase [Chitinophagaceae bacterium]